MKFSCFLLRVFRATRPSIFASSNLNLLVSLLFFVFGSVRRSFGMPFCVERVKMEGSIQSEYLQTASLLLDLDKMLSTVPLSADF